MPLRTSLRWTPRWSIVNPLLTGKTPWIQGPHGDEATGDIYLVQEDGAGADGTWQKW